MQPCCRTAGVALLYGGAAAAAGAVALPLLLRPLLLVLMCRRISK